MTGAKFTDREKVGVSMEASAAIRTTADTVGSMLAGSDTGGSGGCLALTNGSGSSSSAAPSLQALVGVMAAGGNAGGNGAAAKAKAKTKAKAKAKANAVSLQSAKTPQERRDAIRTPAM